jgi:hypothetical protein
MNFWVFIPNTNNKVDIKILKRSNTLLMMNNTEYNNDTPKAARFSDVVWGGGIFLAINLLVAAMYLKIINP